jgi:putative transposase
MARAYLLPGVTIQLRGERHLLKRQFPDGVWEAQSERTGRTGEFPSVVLLEALRAGEMNIVLADTHADRAARARKVPPDPKWERATAEERQEAERKLRYVKAALDKPRARRHLQVAIDDVLKTAPDDKAPSPSTLALWVSRYLSGGKDIASLLMRHSAKGNRSRRIPDALAEKVLAAIEAIYLQRERKTLQDTLDHAIVLVNDHNKLQPDETERLPLPTLRTVRSLLRRFDAFEICAARYGREYALRKFRAVLGEGESDACLAVVEIDHTPVDVIVIDEQTALPLGRPWLTKALDRRSRAVLGYALSFEPPSYLSVMRCLRHAILPKTYLRKEYPEVKNDWPMHGVMETLVVDHGPDLHAKGLESAALRNGITIQYCEKGAPYQKGKIERLLGTVNRGLFQTIPGTTFSNILQRGDYKAEKTAVLTLAAAHKLLHLWIVDVYHQRRHRAIQDTPAHAWESEMSGRPIPLPVDRFELDVQFGVPERRQLTRKGITLNNLVYNSPDCQEVLVKAGQPVEVTVRYLPDDLGSLYLEDPQSGRHIRVPVLQRSREYAEGLTKWQHDLCQRFVLEQLHKRIDVVSLAEAKKRIAQVVEEELLNKTRKLRKKAARYAKADQRGPGSAETEAVTSTSDPASSALPYVDQGRPDSDDPDEQHPPLAGQDAAPVFIPRSRPGGGAVKALP